MSSGAHPECTLDIALGTRPEAARAQPPEERATTQPLVSPPAAEQRAQQQADCQWVRSALYLRAAQLAAAKTEARAAARTLSLPAI